MRNSLHRKKVLLALDSRKKKDESNSDLKTNGAYTTLNLERLDHQWVVRWLDDVGLPQYKDRFLEARVDGRVLNLLTVDDVLIAYVPPKSPAFASDDAVINTIAGASYLSPTAAPSATPSAAPTATAPRPQRPRQRRRPSPPSAPLCPYPWQG